MPGTLSQISRATRDMDARSFGKFRPGYAGPHPKHVRDHRAASDRRPRITVLAVIIRIILIIISPATSPSPPAPSSKIIRGARGRESRTHGRDRRAISAAQPRWQAMSDTHPKTRGAGPSTTIACQGKGGRLPAQACQGNAGRLPARSSGCLGPRSEIASRTSEGYLKSVGILALHRACRFLFRIESARAAVGRWAGFSAGGRLAGGRVSPRGFVSQFFVDPADSVGLRLTGLRNTSTPPEAFYRRCPEEALPRLQLAAAEWQDWSGQRSR